MVNVGGGRRLNLYCTGTGSPSVILDAGTGGSGVDSWARVQPQIAQFTHVCSYDRAGRGFSDSGPLPRDASAAANDLHRLLASARVPKPYVLVGWSMGGLFVRLYADRYPKDVAGLIFVDPAIEYEDARLDAVAPALVMENAERLKQDRYCSLAASRGELRQGTTAYRTCGLPSPPLLWLATILEGRQAAALAELVVRQMEQPGYWTDYASEDESLHANGASSEEVHNEQRSYGDLPLIVLTAGNNWNHEPIPQAQRVAVFNAVKAAHEQIARLSSRGENVVIQGSGHLMPHDDPEAIVAAVKKVVDRSRGRHLTDAASKGTKSPSRRNRA